MHPEAAFLDAYALALVAVATGLARLAQVDTTPQKATMLRAERRTTAPSSPAAVGTGWPHSEAPQLHAAIGGVATTAALVLAVASIIRHHQPVELVASALLFTVIAARVRITMRTRRRFSEVHQFPSPLLPESNHTHARRVAERSRSRGTPPTVQAPKPDTQPRRSR